MTAIVGLVHAGRVWMGADSAATLGGLTLARRDTKVFLVGQAALGFTGSFRAGQLLRHALVLPPIDGMEIARYISTSFVDAVRDCWKAGGIARKDADVESGHCFLVGIAGMFFTVYSDYQVAEHIEPWGAEGCGCEVALGSLWTSAHVCGLAEQPEARVRLALQAASNYCAGVRGPFHIICTEPTP